MHLTVITIPNPTLRERSRDVTLDELMMPSTQATIDSLITTMYADDGIGIAAPQTGEQIRIFVIGKQAIPKGFTLLGEEYHKKKDLVLVNPEWIPISKKQAWDTEGCLSVPKVFGEVRRHKDIRVTALDRRGNMIQFDASGFFARVIQHETDHLNGILFIDRARELYTNDETRVKEHMALVKTQEKYRLL